MRLVLGIRAQPPTGATAAKWLPGTGRYSVTVRRAGAPKLTAPLAGQLILDIRHFINKLFPATLTALNDIMQLTPFAACARLHRGLRETIACQPAVEF